MLSLSSRVNNESHMELSGLDCWLPSKPGQVFLLVTLAAKQRRLRMSFVKPFYGRQDGSDDPDFHSEEIDYAIRKDDHSKADDIERDKIVPFRMYLKDSAGRWFNSVPKATKNHWPTLHNSRIEASPHSSASWSCTRPILRPATLRSNDTNTFHQENSFLLACIACHSYSAQLRRHIYFTSYTRTVQRRILIGLLGL